MFQRDMASRVSEDGFIAALDQSGGSTPGALRLYGVPDNAYRGETEMFALMHAMRVRIMTAPAFTGAKVMGAILFEGTMKGSVEGQPVPSYLWKQRGVVPFLKIDKGLAPEADGVSMMRPIPDLDRMLGQAIKLGVFGTKMRSLIVLPSRTGIAAIVKQQFQVASQVAAHGLLPIVEPEVSIKSSDKPGAEAMLLVELTRALDLLPDERQVILKLTLPDVTNLYAPLTLHPRVARVVALSGGYERDEACERLAVNHGMVASFSRALTEGLKISMSDDEFGAALAEAIEEIYSASVTKH